jgi:ATP-binding cassette subfamily C protein
LPYGQLKLFAVLGLILFNGILQLVGVGSVFPFFALAADPDRIRNSKFGSILLSYLPPLDSNQLLIVAGSFAIILLFIASVGSMISEYLRIRYSYGFSHWLRGRLLGSYASQPFSFFLKRNSAQLNQRILDIQLFTQSVLLPIGEILTRIVLIIFLVAAVFVVQPAIALGALTLFGGFYLIAFGWIRPLTKIVGEKLKFHNVAFLKNTNQFLQGIKTVLIHGKSQYFLKNALIHSSQIGKYMGKIPIYSNGPRYLIEPVAFGGLVAIVVIMALQGRPFSDILPNISVMALAGYKLLPSLQLLYGQLVTVSSSQYTLMQLEEEIEQIENVSRPSLKQVTIPPHKFTFQKEIRMENICFSYPGVDSPILLNFSLSIRKNESIGITGSSGSGKSTLVDILLGLHSTNSGKITIDGEALNEYNIDHWRSIIGYVPQDIYLIDDTIASNIAYGIDSGKINQSALRSAAQGAQILEFIEKELPQGFLTIVGERGVRLSGGQRQRIGLARALYHNPQILILDESTSALDTQTELAVMDTINHLKGALTIIIIAHRISTLKNCSRVINIKSNTITI